MAITSPRDRLYSSGELAKATGVAFENIRYFERIALIPPAQRLANGRRVFSDRHFRRLVFIRRARELGFTQDEVRTLLHLSDGSPSRCAEVKVLADHHLLTIRGKIAALRKMEDLLDSVASRCNTEGSIACPIIDVLAENEG